jgi:Leucine-rich repeat (LRR) protein
LRYLKKLDLGRNRIRRIDGLNQLESLTQLSMEDNEI